MCPLLHPRKLWSPLTVVDHTALEESPSEAGDSRFQKYAIIRVPITLRDGRKDLRLIGTSFGSASAVMAEVLDHSRSTGLYDRLCQRWFGLVVVKPGARSRSVAGPSFTVTPPSAPDAHVTSSDL